MNASLFALGLGHVIAPSIILPVCALVAIVAIGWLVYAHVASKPAPVIAAAAPAGHPAGVLGGMLGGVDRLLHLHTGGELPQRLSSVLRALGRFAIEYDKAQDHKELNALLAHVVPGLAPLLPIIDKGVDLAENKALGTITIPPTEKGHRVLSLLEGLLGAESKQQAKAA